MNVNTLLERCQEIILLLSDFGTRVFNFLFSTIDFFGADVVLIEVLFGAGLITFLTAKIISTLIPL